MSLLQLNLSANAIAERPTRRALIDAICDRTPTGPGMGQRNVPKSRQVDATLGRQVVIEGASPAVCQALGIPADWAARCEDAFHTGHDNTREALADRIDAFCWPPEPFPSSPRRSRNLAPTEAETILANVNWFMWPTASGHAKWPGFSV